MLTVFEVLPNLMLGALAGPLVVAGAAKLRADPASVGWPVERGLLAPPHGPRLAGAAELIVAAALVAAPGPAAAGIGLAAYLALTVAATALYGQRCACFGTSRLAAIGRTHVAANAAGAGTAALTFALPGGPGYSPVLRGVAAAFAFAVTSAVLRRRRVAPAERTLPCTERVSAVHLYTAEGCPSCRSLKALLATMEPARRDRVVTTVLGPGEEPPAPLSGDMGVPAAYAVDATGLPVCAPAVGIGPVKALIDTITIGPRVPS